MNTYTINFYRRGTLKKIYMEWKNKTQIIHRKKAVQAVEKRIENEIINSTAKTNEEADLLRKMISELTEDLRNESLAKNQLKYKFEQAMYRGISALNQESNNMQNGVFTQPLGSLGSDKNYLSTPDKIGFLARS